MSSTSSLHLAKGSKKPEAVKDQGRLYSMKYCPFAHRVQLILTLKQIPHEVVNINLQNKPDWYFEIHPEGKVPAYVDTDGTIVTDSLAIANYLDQKYPLPQLHSYTTESRDLELINHFSKIIDTFSNCIHDKDKRQFEEIIVEAMDNLQEFEEELGIRKTPFFVGNKPGMLDILMWPWFERAKALTILYKQRASLDRERFPNLMDWLDEMRGQWFVEKHKCSYEKFAKFIEATKTGNVDYDNI
ncbi:pyrimidodiazepine synthase [Anoplolepis gracilipes]|uniref:pyrimidodiazepine synthase n=1 Tax=Anoplolepis gracilipes TaxID=354296 RepID=UPI003B9EAB86